MTQIEIILEKFKQSINLNDDLSVIITKARAAGLNNYIAEIKKYVEDEVKKYKDRFKFNSPENPEPIQNFFLAKIAILAALLQKFYSDVYVNTRPELSTNFEKIIKNLSSKLTVTIENEVFSTVHGVLNQVATANGVSVFVYVGPLDEKTRPFCRRYHVSTGFKGTIDKFNSLDNGAGQPKPVSLYGGGFNCRHYLEPIT